MTSLGLSVQEGAEVSSLGPHSLNMISVMKELREDYPGFSFDRGGNLNFWHPRIEDKQSVYFGAKHVCSVDRGWSPQWPIFSTVDSMMEVPLSYAIKHEDFPVLDILPGQSPKDSIEMLEDTNAKAMVLRPQLDDINYLGWAEFFFKIIRLGLPGLDSRYLATKFHVPLDWYHASKTSPVAQGFQQAKAHCGG